MKLSEGGDVRVGGPRELFQSRQSAVVLASFPLAEGLVVLGEERGAGPWEISAQGGELFLGGGELFLLAGKSLSGLARERRQARLHGGLEGHQGRAQSGVALVLLLARVPVEAAERAAGKHDGQGKGHEQSAVLFDVEVERVGRVNKLVVLELLPLQPRHAVHSPSRRGCKPAMLAAASAAVNPPTARSRDYFGDP